MDNATKKIPINCHFCAKQIGEATVPTESELVSVLNEGDHAETICPDCNVVSLDCRFCETNNGSITFSSDKNMRGKTHADVGIADHRCDDCNIEHGIYKDMYIFHDRDLRFGADRDQHNARFDALMKECDGKASEFVDRLAHTYPDYFFKEVQHPEHFANVQRDRLAKHLGIDKIEGADWHTLPQYQAEVVRRLSKGKPLAKKITDHTAADASKHIVKVISDHSKKLETIRGTEVSPIHHA